MKKQEIILSIIIPIYNMEKYLNKCLDSILVKNYENLECILVDDGSTDSSRKILDIFIKKYNNTNLN